MIEDRLLEILEEEIPNQFFLDKSYILKCMIIAYELGEKKCQEKTEQIDT